MLIGRVILTENMVKSVDVGNSNQDEIEMPSYLEEYEMPSYLEEYLEDSDLENYTNDELRAAVFFSRGYLNRPELLKEEHPSVYDQWYEYRLNTCHNEFVNTLMDYYNDWIIAYAFGVSIEYVQHPTSGPLPRYDKEDNFQNYTCEEIENGIGLFKPYLNKPELFNTNHRALYNLWYDYRYRVCHSESINTIMERYNYWIMSYPFRI